MNYSIDEIMDMLDWGAPLEIQSLGREAAKNIRCINVFIQPGHPGHCKNVWENCAIILSNRSDLELHPYLDRLFEWMRDMNWPGAPCIEKRLKLFKDKKWFHYVLKECIKEAQALGDDAWLQKLLEFQQHDST